MGYILPAKHRCDYCGFEMFYTRDQMYVGLPLAAAAEPGTPPDPVCPKCWSEFIRKHCGILKLKQPVEVQR